MGKTVNVYLTGHYPCQWDDLIIGDGEKAGAAVVQTKAEAAREAAEQLRFGDGDGVAQSVGIRRAEDGIWEIVIDVPELTEEIVAASLVELGKLTGETYVAKSWDMRFYSVPTPEPAE